MTEKKMNPGKRGRKPKLASELRSAYLTVRCRIALKDQTLTALKLARDQVEGLAVAVAPTL